MSRCTERHDGCVLAGEMARPTAIRIDLRAVLPVAIFALIVFIIIFVQLCGTEDVKPLSDQTPLAQATRAPTFTPAPGATAAPSATAAPAGPTATEVSQVDAGDRDQVRSQDLTQLQAVLEQYKTKHDDKYPSTGGGIQTLCVYKDADKGCALEDVLSTLPTDPLGDASTNGYWYKSDGTTYTLYAQRESNAVPQCPDHPQHLQKFKSLMCVLSP
jgi:hypothetical protein